MFDLIASYENLFLITVYSFIIISVIGQLFITNKARIIIHIISLIFLFLFIVDDQGGSINDDYEYLDKFIALERNNELETARHNLKNYPDLSFFLTQFKNSSQYKNYIKQNEKRADETESFFIGWILAFLTELIQILVFLFNCLRQKIRHKKDRN